MVILARVGGSLNFFKTLMLFYCSVSSHYVFGSPYIPKQGQVEVLVSNQIYFDIDSKALMQAKYDTYDSIELLEKWVLQAVYKKTKRRIAKDITSKKERLNKLPHSYPISVSKIGIEYSVTHSTSIGVQSSIMQYYQYEQGRIISASVSPCVKYNLYKDNKYILTASASAVINSLSYTDNICDIGLSFTYSHYSKKDKNIKFFNYYDLNISPYTYQKSSIVGGCEYKEKYFATIVAEYVSNIKDPHFLDSNMLRQGFIIGQKLHNNATSVFFSYSVNSPASSKKHKLSYDIQIGLQYK